MELHLADNSTFPASCLTNEGKTAERTEAILKTHDQTLRCYKIDVDLLAAINIQFSVHSLLDFLKILGCGVG